MRATAGVIFLFFIAFGAGCATVKPWERGTLSEPSMDPENPSKAVCDRFIYHTVDVREGAVGCIGSAGGGCGCN